MHNYAREFRQLMAKYTLADFIFTKKDHEALFTRVQASAREMKEELLTGKSLVFVHKIERLHQGLPEPRYQCYFIYSNSKGRCYVIRLNSEVKIITAYPLGRGTIRAWKRKYRRETRKDI